MPLHLSQNRDCQALPSMTCSRRLTEASADGQRKRAGRMRQLTTMIAVSTMAVALAGCAPLILGGAATTAYVATQHRGLGGFATDAEIRATINHLWLQHSIAMTQRISLSVDNGRVLLTGRATDPQMRLDAVRLSWQATGVTEVINEIQVDNESGLLDSAKDTWITTQLRTRLTFDSTVMSRNYSIDTVNGTVYLTGLAVSQEEVNRIIDHARSVAGVQHVVNHTRILPPAS